MPKRTRTTSSLAVVFLPMAVAACGGPAPPHDELADARTAVQQAEGGIAPSLASAELGIARNHLREAQAAMAEGEYAQARRLAETAIIDTELAVARADEAQALRNVRELERALEALGEGP